MGREPGGWSDSDSQGDERDLNIDPFNKTEFNSTKDTSGIAPYSLHPDDPAAFLKLTAFLNIFLAEYVMEGQLQQASALVCSYCKDFIWVCALLHSIL